MKKSRLQTNDDAADDDALLPVGDDDSKLAVSLGAHELARNRSRAARARTLAE